MRRLLSVATVLVCAGVAMSHAAPALAHTGLESASPGPGQQVRPGVEVIALTFTEPLNTNSRRVTVTGPDDTEIPSGESVLVNNRTLCLSVEPLTAGVWSVDYAATSYDGHPTDGTFLFEVTPTGHKLARPARCAGVELPAASTSNTAANTPADPAEQDAASGPPTGTLALAGGLVALGAALAGWLVARRRRSSRPVRTVNARE